VLWNPWFTLGGALFITKEIQLSPPAFLHRYCADRWASRPGGRRDQLELPVTDQEMPLVTDARAAELPPMGAFAVKERVLSWPGDLVIAGLAVGWVSS